MSAIHEYAYNAYIMSACYTVVWAGQASNLNQLILTIEAIGPHYGYILKRDGAHNLLVWDTVKGERVAPVLS